MRGEDERRLAVVAQLVEARRGLGREFEPLGMLCAQVVEMRELGGEPAEIIPGTTEDYVDLLR